MKNDEYGNRMKRYEQVTKTRLPARTYTIVRVDGRAFHTYLRNAEKPFDSTVNSAMDLVAATMCKEMSGAKFAYVQSDEISILLTDLGPGTQPWFDGEVQKIVSISASLATAVFNGVFTQPKVKYPFADTELPGPKYATFDARVYSIPSRTEVANYFRWRQQDAIRNAVQSAGYAEFPAREMFGKNAAQIQEMLFQERGINFKTKYSDRERRGGVAVKETYRHEGVLPVRKVRRRDGGEPATVPVEREVRTFSTLRTRWISPAALDFTWADGSFLANHIPMDEPGPAPWSLPEKLPASLASKVTNADDAWVIREVFRIIEDDDDARAWLIGMNPFLNDKNPFLEILADNGRAVLAAARAHAEGSATS